MRLKLSSYVYMCMQHFSSWMRLFFRLSDLESTSFYITTKLSGCHRK